MNNWAVIVSANGIDYRYDVYASDMIQAIFLAGARAQINDLAMAESEVMQYPMTVKSVSQS